MSYFKEREIETLENIRDRLVDLPPMCHKFFAGIAQKTSPLTRLNYAYDLRLFLEFLRTEVEEFVELRTIDFNEKHLEQLEAFHIEMFLAHLEPSNGPQGKSRKLATLRTFFAYLFKMDMISKNILPKVDMPKIHDKTITRLDPDEIRMMFDQITDIRDRTILLMFLSTGIRVSELVGLDIGDIDMKNESFRVTRKGGKQEILYMPIELTGQMAEYLETFEHSNTTPLFGTIKSPRITVRAVQNMVKKYATIATPLKNISPHKLRSTFGTNLYRETGDIYVVADVLGHKDVNTTRKHYAAMSEDIKREAANRVKILKD